VNTRLFLLEVHVSYTVEVTLIVNLPLKNLSALNVFHVDVPVFLCI